MSFELRFATPVAASAALAADVMGWGTLLPTPTWYSIRVQDGLEAFISRSVGRLTANGATGIAVAGNIAAGGNVSAVNVTASGTFTGNGSGLTNLPSSSGAFPFNYRTPVNPILDTFAWINQGTATVTASSPTIYLEDSDGYSGDQLRVRKRAIPATPYTVTLGFCLNPHYLQTSVNAGIVLRESGTGKLVSYGYLMVSLGGIFPLSFKYTNATTASTAYFQGTGPWPGSVFYVRITDNGTNVLVYFSTDGTHWNLFDTRSRTDFMLGGPDEVGFYFNNLGAGAGAARPAGILVFDWAVT